MIPPLSTRLVAAVLLATLAVSLASCGRKGALEPDPHSPSATLPAEDDGPADGRDTRPRQQQPRPFPLDPML